MDSADKIDLSRRRLLKAFSGIGAALSTGWLMAPKEANAALPPLTVFVPSTNEHVTMTLFQPNGARDPRMPFIMDWLARDRREGVMAQIDRRIYDLLYLLSRLSGGSRVELLSGYRTPRTNALLASRSEAVAIQSLHIQAKALDFRIPGLHNAHIARIAWRLGFGGVGLYGSSFVHVDTGARRRWGDPFPE